MLTGVLSPSGRRSRAVRSGGRLLAGPAATPQDLPRPGPCIPLCKGAGVEGINQSKITRNKYDRTDERVLRRLRDEA